MSTSSRPKLKTAFKKARTIAPLYTAGPVAVTGDGSKLVSCVGEDAILTDIKSGVELCRFSGDTANITALCVTETSSHVLLFTSSLSLRIYELPATSTPLSKPVQPIRVVARAHDAPIHVCKADPTSAFLASGSADGVVKVWDILRGYVTHVFKGHGGVVSALAFVCPRDPAALGRPLDRDGKLQLVTASVDTRVRIFDLKAARTGAPAKPDAVLEGHVSVPRGLDVSEDGRWLVSGGRDSVVLLWDLEGSGKGAARAKSKGKGKEKEAAPRLVNTIPVLERVEAVGLLRSDEALPGSSSVAQDALRFYTGGEKGVVKVWDAHQGAVITTFGKEDGRISDEQEEQRQIVDAIYVPATSTVVSVHADQNIMFHSIATRTLTRQLIGFNDEIVDATFLSSAPASHPASQRPDTHVALATNSSLIRIYSATSLDARLLEGHTDIVLCLDHGCGSRVLASGSKDRSARIWAPLSASTKETWGWGCVAICEGHAESIGAIALSRKAGTDSDGAAGPRFMFTGSQDRTIKMWDLSSVRESCEDADNTPAKCRSLATHRAHEKDINALDVAPNDRFLASASQDKTAKVFAIEHAIDGKGAARGELRLLGTCTGHKRGVWSVRFGRAERVLATGSGDKTVRLWNLDDFTCVKTFEGHTNSVLRVDFINFGTQMVSSASDGLVKLWNVREEECVATMDNHEDKVWALAVSSDERTVVSGAADSVVTFWEDCTEEQEQEKESKRADLVLKEQDFANYLSLKDYRRAITLALAMEQPGRLYSLFKGLRSADADADESSSSSITGNAAVDEVIRTLAGPELVKLLRYVRDWNARAGTSIVAQGVLYAVVRLRAAEDVMGAFGDSVSVDDTDGGAASGNATSLKELVDGLLPYTERHLARMDRLLQESYVVDYILGEMDDGMFDGESEGSVPSEDEEDSGDDDNAMDVDGDADIVDGVHPARTPGNRRSLGLVA